MRRDGQSIGVGTDLLCGLMDRAAHRVVGQHQAFEFLLHEVRGLAAQKGAGAEHVGFHLVMGGPDPAAFVAEGCRFDGRRNVGIKQCCDQGMAFRHARQVEHEHPHPTASPAGPAVPVAAGMRAQP